MSTENLYLAVFLGSKTGARRAAWGAWVAKHQGAITELGRPLGKTKKISSGGIADTSNEMGTFTVVRAASHDAAACLFENHPHFTIFPGDRVEIMPILAVPGSATR